jgi:hypothetical protein
MTEPATAPARNKKLMTKHELQIKAAIQEGLRRAARRIAARIAAELRLPPEEHDDDARS